MANSIFVGLNVGSGGGGGGGTPGGVSGQVQFNNAGAFGGFGAWDGVDELRLQNADIRQSLRIYRGTGAGPDDPLNSFIEIFPAVADGTSIIRTAREDETISGALQFRTISAPISFHTGTVNFALPISPGGAAIRGDKQLFFSDTTSFDPVNGPFDNGLKRLAASSLQFTDGGAGIGAVQSLYDRFGSGSPETVVSAPVGATYHRTDGGAGTSLYVKQSGTGNTGWVAVTP